MRFSWRSFGFGIALVVATVCVWAPTCSAAGFDGTYDYTYTLRGPNGWETHHVSAGLRISDSVVSSNPPALSGAVDAQGGVHFTGPCPYGDPQATFTGRLTSNGQGSGQYECPYGHSGSWSVARLARADGGFVNGLTTLVDTVFGFLAGVGGILAFSNDEFVNAAVGGVLLVVVLVCITVLVGSAAAASRRRRVASPKGPGDGAFVTRGSYEARVPGPGDTPAPPAGQAKPTPTPSPIVVAGGVLAVIAGFLDLLFGILVVFGSMVIQTTVTNSQQLGVEAGAVDGTASTLAVVAGLAFLVGGLGMLGGILARRRPLVAAILMLLAGAANLLIGLPGMVVGALLALGAFLVIVGWRRRRTPADAAQA